MSAVVVACTVTGTGWLVAVLPAPSRAVAVGVWGPAVVVAVFHSIEYGGSMISEPRGAPSRKNWTPRTSILSLADATRVIVLVTDAFGRGAVMATVGGVVSGGM